MKKVKIYIMKMEYDNTNWIFIHDENHQISEIKLSNKEYEKLKQQGIPTADEILKNVNN